MACIVCFADTPSVVEAVNRGLVRAGYTARLFSATTLDRDVRADVEQCGADLILFEVSNATDNAAIYFFLRADQRLRHVPMIVIAHNPLRSDTLFTLAASEMLVTPLSESAIVGAARRHMLVTQSAAA